jgi:hypothetical protein
VEVFEAARVLLDVPLQREHAVPSSFEATENTARFGSGPGICTDRVHNKTLDGKIPIPDPPCDIQKGRGIAMRLGVDRSEVAVKLLEGRATIKL